MATVPGALTQLEVELAMTQMRLKSLGDNRTINPDAERRYLVGKIDGLKVAIIALGGTV